MRVKLKKNEITLILISIIMGISAVIIIYGTKILNPLYTDWLMHQGDLTQHYIGWLAFRNDAWRFPPGVMKNVIYPYGTSVVFMDSIPLAAIIFKIFNPVLPENFQYFGIWSVITYSAQAYFAIKLMNRLTKNPLVIFICSVFFLFSPILMQRMFFHTALASHFLILAAIFLLLEKKNNIVCWAVLCGLSITIHFYLTAIIFILFLASLIYIFFTTRNTKLIVKAFLINLGVMLLTAYLVGYFTGTSGASQDGFGIFSMNLNALINPVTYSAFLKSLPSATPGQHESFMYLGLGVIFGLSLALFALIQKPRFFIDKNNKEKNLMNKIFMVIILLASIYAISNVVTLNDRVIFTIPLPSFIMSLCNIFRASARFFWLVYYLLIYFMFYVLLKACPKSGNKVIITALLVFLQICDLSAPIAAKREEFNSSYKYENILTSDIWDDIGKKLSHAIIVGDNIVFKNYAYFIDRLIPYGMTVNDAYLARDINEVPKKYTLQKLDELKRGKIDGDTVFILESYSQLRGAANFDLYNANGFYLALPAGKFNGNYAECKKISTGAASSDAPKIKAGTANKANNDFYKAYDNDPRTYWISNSNQEARDVIKIEFEGNYNINGIALESPKELGGYPRSLSIYYSTDDISWSKRNVSYAAQGTIYKFDGVYCKYLRIELDKDVDKPWVISEIILL